MQLNRDFVNTSIIIPQFEDPRDFFESPTAIEWAKTIQQQFSYPVDSIVLSPQGQPLAQLEVMQAIRGNAYDTLLSDALKAMKAMKDASPQDQE